MHTREGVGVWGHYVYTYVMYAYTCILDTYICETIYLYSKHSYSRIACISIYVHICIHDCVMLCGLFPLGFAFWEFRVCFLKACVRVLCVHMCVGL
jgi:hypothetical protein